MKIYIVVKHTEEEVVRMDGGSEYVTETEILEAYGNKQDANFEARYLSRQLSYKDDNVVYYVIETELN